MKYVLNSEYIFEHGVTKYESYHTEMASDYAIQKLKAILLKMTYQQIEQRFLTELLNQDQLYRIDFEVLVIMELKKGMTWKMFPMHFTTLNITPKPRNFPQFKEINIEQIPQVILSDILYRPSKEHFPFTDFIFIHTDGTVVLIKATIGMSRRMSISAFEKMETLLGLPNTTKYELYCVMSHEEARQATLNPQTWNFAFKNTKNPKLSSFIDRLNIFVIQAPYNKLTGKKVIN
jgi:hypothetical protein